MGADGRIIARVHDDVPDAFQPLDQPARLWTVAPLPGRDREPDRQPERIHSGVDLRGQAALGATDTGSFKPPF